MKRLMCLIAIMLPVVVLAGPISVNFDPPSVVFDAVSQGMSEWADDPIGTCTGTGDNQCCTGAATDLQCQTVATNFRSSRDFWTRRIYTCIRNNANWQCETWNDSRGIIQMGCQTIPGTEAVILADVATCISAEAILP